MTAELLVEVADGALRAAVLPVQVRRPSMVVAAYGSTGEPIPVEPGQYVVVVSVPGGEELSGRVDVGSDERRTVELAPARGSVEVPAAATPSAAGPHRTVHLLLVEGSPLEQPLRPVGSSRVEFPGPGLSAPEPPRALRVRSRRFVLGGLASGRTWTAPDRCELRLLLPGPPGTGPGFWLRVTAPPDRTRVVAVPAVRGETCTLVVTLEPGRRSPVVEFHLADPTLDAFLQYRATADVTSARAMLEAGAAGRAATSPVAKALLGYAALRWGVEGYGSGAGRMAPTDTDLPDTWIVEGERSARDGEHDRARELFGLALRAGFPVFGDGLGLLSTRLPQYLRLMTAGVLEESTPLRSEWARLVGLLRIADLKPVPLTLRGDLDIAGPPVGADPVSAGPPSADP